MQVPDTTEATSEVNQHSSAASAATGQSSTYSSSSSTSFSFHSSTLGTTVTYGASESMSSDHSSTTPHGLEASSTPYEDLHRKIEDLERSNKYGFNRLLLFRVLFNVLLVFTSYAFN